MQSNLTALDLLMRRNEDVLKGWSYRATEQDIDIINSVPRPRDQNKPALRSLFFPIKDDKTGFFQTMTDNAFQRAE
jgi:hypothetical protein